MAALHTALQALSPVDFSHVPTSTEELDQYLAGLHAQAQTIVESIPIADPDEGLTRPRAKTISSLASNASEMSASAARSEPPPAHIASLQKEWGKPLKLKPSENVLGVSVYKAAGKDGRGAWFARRSVHEGVGFAKFKAAFQNEFPASLAVQGAPGEGNIRGIGAETRVEQIEVPNRGKVEVYQLSAQFPGPTTPRDFVTFLVTSSNAMKPHGDTSELMPRNYMIISKPCNHPETQPRAGFIRGQYESVEFIREVPRKLKVSASQTNLSHLSHGHQKHSNDMAQDLLIRNAQKLQTQLRDGSQQQNDALMPPRHSSSRSPSPVGRRRSRTVGVAENFSRRSQDGFEYDPEDNPVEWIMVTRSDPGGSVPRFLVERGTPASICSDAVKFLDWACQLDEDVASPTLSTHPTRAFRRESFTSFENEERLAGVSEEDETFRPVIDETEHRLLSESVPTSRTNTSELSMATHDDSATSRSSGVAASVSGQLSNVVPPTVARHGPQAAVAEDPSTTDSQDVPSTTVDDDLVSTLSSISWASAESHVSSNFVPENQSSSSVKNEPLSDAPSQQLQQILAQHAKAMLKLSHRKDTLDVKFAQQREKLDKQKENATETEQAALKKAEEKHERDVKKYRERHDRDIQKLHQRKRTETQKLEAKQRKQAEKDERDKLRLERDEAVKKLQVLEQERDMWIKQPQPGTVGHASALTPIDQDAGKTMETSFETKAPSLPPFGIRELYGTRTGILHISQSQYESTVRSYPDAVLTYADDDDGDVITVGSGLELRQRLGEPIRAANRRQSSKVQGSTSRRGSVDDSMIHLFDIQHSDDVLAIWREHEAYSSKSLRRNRTSSAESDQFLQQPNAVQAGPNQASSVSQPEPLDSQPEPLDSQPEPLDTQPEPLDSQPEPLNTQPEPLHPQPEPLNTQPEPLHPQPELLRPQPKVRSEAQHPTPTENADVSLPATGGIKALPNDFRQDLDTVFSAACKGLESLGLADILDNTAHALHSLAQKTRDSDASPIEIILGGFKDVVTEIGQLGLEIVDNLDKGTASPSPPNADTVSPTTNGENVVCKCAKKADAKLAGRMTKTALKDAKTATKEQRREEKRARRLEKVAQREARRAIKKGKTTATTTAERAQGAQDNDDDDERAALLSPDMQKQPVLALESSKRVSFANLQDEIRSTFAGPDPAGTERPLSEKTSTSKNDLLLSAPVFPAPLNVPRTLNRLVPVLPQPAADSLSSNMPTSIMDIESSNPDFTARYPPLTSLRRAHTVSELRKKNHDAAPASIVPTTTKAALTRYPTIGQLEAQQRVVGPSGRDQVAAMQADMLRRRNQLKADSLFSNYRAQSAEDAGRLHVYASAAAGELDKAIDMIEEDRKAAEALTATVRVL
ncbi:hypothetical protein DV737_g3540, partial [Chaetothyriales sp. CBS 132003]